MEKRFIEERILAGAIPKDMIIRWEEILTNGLPTDDRVALVKKYPPPSNGAIIDLRKVNPEVRASIQESVIKRDEQILAKQTKTTACLSAVGKAFSNIIESRDEKLKALELLSDVGRLLADLQHDESIIRKSLILANLNASFKDILNAAVPDEWLFGKQLDAKLKLAKALEIFRKDLKPAPKVQVNKPTKNLMLPPRRPIYDVSSRQPA